MKIISIIKKNKLLLAVALAYAVIFIVSPDKALKSVNNSIYYLIEMLQVLPVIFLLTVVIDALVPKEVIMQGFGEKSGIKGNLLALLLGSISAGPIYAAFPISKMLLGKGASITNIVIILSSWAVIKVPMLANEAKFLGLNFMIVRWILTVAAIFIMAYITAVIVKKKDIIKEEVAESNVFEIKEEYCIGCGLCAESLPEYYHMVNNKAAVIAVPAGKEKIEAVIKSVNECPTNAITFKQSKEIKSDNFVGVK
ncbi:MAG: permease [Eubacteriales bacterium]